VVQQQDKAKNQKATQAPPAKNQEPDTKKHNSPHNIPPSAKERDQRSQEKAHSRTTQETQEQPQTTIQNHQIHHPRTSASPNITNQANLQRKDID
jgi:hypothetical protein